MPDLKPDGLRCQWVRPGGWPQCTLLHGHIGAHLTYDYPPRPPGLPVIEPTWTQRLGEGHYDPEDTDA